MAFVDHHFRVHLISYKLAIVGLSLTVTVTTNEAYPFVSWFVQCLLHKQIVLMTLQSGYHSSKFRLASIISEEIWLHVLQCVAVSVAQISHIHRATIETKRTSKSGTNKQKGVFLRDFLEVCHASKVKSHYFWPRGDWYLYFADWHSVLSYRALCPPQRLSGGGEVDRGKRRCAWDDGKTERRGALFSLPPSQRSPRAFVYPLPSLQIAYTAKQHARAPRKREIGLCGGESIAQKNFRPVV